VANSGVRPALVDDSAEIARIQLLTWRAAYAGILPASVLAGLDEAAARDQWAAALRAGHPMLIALDGARTVGFAAYVVLGATVEIGPLLVEPRWGRRGHGSRLLAGAIDLARQSMADQAIMWIPRRDAASESFLIGAGWGLDGRVRTLDTGDGLVQEMALRTAFG
jgi:GNAT superfamily N-acetyltransferase